MSLDSVLALIAWAPVFIALISLCLVAFLDIPERIGRLLIILVFVSLIIALFAMLMVFARTLSISF